MIRVSVRNADEERREKRNNERRAMTTQLSRPTAKIYTFPSGGRAPPSHYREVRKSTSHATAARTAHDERVAKVEYGNCWYHDAAVVEEAEETWER
jgi:hypothetical protein